jgi:hypothetical protein
MHISCREKSRGDWRSGKEHAAHLGHHKCVSHRSQVGEEVEFQIAVSKRRVWTRSLKRATLRMTSRGRSKCMYLGGGYQKKAGAQNSKWLSIMSMTNRLRSLGSQFNSFCFNMYDCVKPSMVERMWEGSQESWSSIACQLAKPFFIVELLHWVRGLYRCIAARNQLNRRDSRPHSTQQLCLAN